MCKKFMEAVGGDLPGLVEMLKEWKERKENDWKDGRIRKRRKDERWTKKKERKET
jgi:hypothetical protein